MNYVKKCPLLCMCYARMCAKFPNTRKKIMPPFRGYRRRTFAMSKGNTPQDKTTNTTQIHKTTNKTKRRALHKYEKGSQQKQQDFQERHNFSEAQSPRLNIIW